MPTPIDPPARTLRWVERCAGKHFRAIRVERLVGGTATAVHRVVLQGPSGSQTRLVLRRYAAPSGPQSGGLLVAREARILRSLEGSGVAAPRLVDCDAEGHQSDVPAIVFHEISGALVIDPVDLEGWLRAIAAPLPRIHATTEALGGDPPLENYQSYWRRESLRIPLWTSDRALWHAAHRLLEETPDEVPTFIHRDYHPTNLLFQAGKVSGVLDWVNAARGPAAIDVGHCRANLACLHSPDVADRFLDGYREIVGITSADPHPYWDLVTALEFTPEPGVYPPWITLGRTDLRPEHTRRNLEEHVRRIVARLR